LLLFVARLDAELDRATFDRDHLSARGHAHADRCRSDVPYVEQRPERLISFRQQMLNRRERGRFDQVDHHRRREHVHPAASDARSRVLLADDKRSLPLEPRLELRRHCRHYPCGMSEAPHVVIIGAGFGGLWAAQALARAPVRVTVLDRTNHHVFQPLLYQVATAGLAAPAISAPIRHVLADQKNATVLLGEAKASMPLSARSCSRTALKFPMTI
jgi:hypothetical protein